ncbi:hypothetical protein K492DRAFT_237403 [Lichtheimia hyalospora FSU 10163]|nr:hypothetical protein K492DRAFT_237403 [Lichtheimia hyalospora FSU 10163]
MLQNSTTQSDNAMSLLSTFLLQGWVMTDEHCRVPDCPVPIMRSKDGSIRFCVTHDTLPTGSAKQTASSHHAQSDTQQQEQRQEQVIVQEPPAAAAAAGDRQGDDDDARRIQLERREQSSRASQLIGQKMLQRWTLLNETCPNPECYAIPLMRDLSKRMVCVICERTYLTEEQAAEAGANIKQQEQSTPAVEERHQAKQEIEKHDDSKSVTKKDHYEQQRPVSLSTPSETYNSSITEPIIEKIHQLSQRVQSTNDAIELKQLFEAIEAGANAIKSCRLVNL